jgi:hypothetical protein
VLDDVFGVGILLVVEYHSYVSTDAYCGIVYILANANSVFLGAIYLPLLIIA